MRVTALILAVVAATLLGGVGRAAAEKVKTNQTTKVYAGPGEQRKVILKLQSGQNMTLLAQDGRWLKVRVRGRTGYVPRSKVDMADDGTIARNTRRRPFVDGRSRRRGFGGEAGPDDRIGADAIGEGQEDTGSDEGEEEEDDEEETPRKGRKEVATRNAREDDEDDEADDGESESSDEDEAGDEDVADDEEDVDDEEDSRPTARVTKKVSALEEADPDSDEMFVARSEDVLYPTGNTDGDWTEVETEEGDIGWIRTEYIDTGSGGGMGKRQIDVGARLGFMFIQQAMRTAGSDNLKVPDNYNIGTSSVTLSLGGSYKMPYKKKYILGGELTYDYSKTLFGGIFYDPDGKDMPMPGVNTGVTVHNLNLRAMAGYDLKKKSGMAVFGRLGYRYQSFLVDNYLDAAKNPARIPQEVVKGPTLGAAFVMPKLTDKIGIEVALDTILFGGSIKQTKGLEDGSAPTLKAITLGAGVTYRWKKNMDLEATYDLRYMGVDFGPPLATSMRGHMGNNVKRTDIFHMVTVGIAKPF